MQDFKNHKTNLESLINKKVKELQNIENMRSQLITEITKIQGRLEMINELISEPKDEPESKDESENKPENESDVNQGAPDSSDKK